MQKMRKSVDVSDKINKLARYINKTLRAYGYLPPKPVLVHIFFWDAWTPVIVYIDYLHSEEKTYTHIEVNATISEPDRGRKDDKIWFRYDGRVKGFTGQDTRRSNKKFVTQKNGNNMRELKNGYSRLMDAHDCDVIYELFEKVMTEIQIEFEQIVDDHHASPTL
jgi:hypothetical protein